MKSYVVAFDLTDDAINAAASYLAQNGAQAIDLNQTEWPDVEKGCKLYLVGHGCGLNFQKYSNPKDLFNDYKQLGEAYNRANEVYLISCSTNSEEDLLLDGGFQAATFAKNLKNFNSGKKVIAAVGPVHVGKNGLVVEVPKNIQGVTSNNGWVEL